MKTQTDWIINRNAPPEFLSKFPKIHPVIANLFYSRGIIEQSDMDSFLNPDYYKDLRDPFLMTDMKKAVGRIIDAVKNKEKIIVFGDYDADGVCASVLMVQTLKLLGAQVSVYIPDRAKEGYGMNLKATQEIIDGKANLIITVDCGVSNYKETKLAQSNGIDVIITDHHSITQKLPPAFAVINPKQEGDQYPFKDLAGVGVAYKLVCALLSFAVETRLIASLNEAETYLKWCLDVVALGTVADVCPLLGENRVLVKFGLMVLERNRRIGLSELLKISQLYDGESRLSLSSHNIGYQIGPRLNASGRMDHANTSYQLLITKSEIEARNLACQIEEKNTRRQNLTKQIINKIKKDFNLAEDGFIFASLPECPVGIAGLVAGKLCDEFAKPAFIISENEELSKGSCRAPEYLAEKNFHLGNFLSECKEYLEGFGGHAQAAGFSVKTKNIPALKSVMQKMFSKKWDKEVFDGKQALKIDCELSADDIGWDLLSAIQGFAPFGEGNPQPLFSLKNVLVYNSRRIGNGEKHLKLTLQLPRKNGTINYIDAIAFGFGNIKINSKDRIDVAFYLEENEWNGSKSLQLRVVDIKKN